jgi:glycosyltransferase involved in cell wall biosynthesis
VIPGQIAVVIPARNEENWLPTCLAALDAARVHILHTVPRVFVTVTVVLDRCTDNSGNAARSFPGISIITGNFGSVGAARDAGIRFALGRSRSLPERTWVANTDADTLVPRDWLVRHYHLSSKYQLVLGTVQPTTTAYNTSRLQKWSQTYTPGDGHHHVHGANLGIGGKTYLDLGGFHPLTHDEDVNLTNRAKAQNVTWTASGSIRVTTSSRTVGRVPSGFSTYLRMLS